MTITIRNDFEVELVEHAGSDALICKAARVSTLGSASLETTESFGLINFLMKNRHGSPFEHGFDCFRIKAPIFVWREFMRHRIGISYNEQSARYMELSPEFYVPPFERALIQVGKPGYYEFIPGPNDLYQGVLREFKTQYEAAWRSYQVMLRDDVAKEVARMVLPVGIYSTAYVSMNPRSIMHFLSLRTKSEGSTFPSYPQWEINQVANLIEHHFGNIYPITLDAFNRNGRVCP